jgi:hypothetical protein
MFDRIRRFEVVIEAGSELDQVVGDQLTADEQRNGESAHARSAFGSSLVLMIGTL